MIQLDIPGREALALEHPILDYNGTIAFDGALISGVKESLERLSKELKIHVITADTFGSVASQVESIDCQLFVLPSSRQSEAKADYVRKCGSERSICIGNGYNDCLMLKEAALSIALIQQEGAAFATLQAADVVCNDILSALGLLTHRLRLIATLRN